MASYVVCAVVTLVSALVSLGYSVAAVRAAGAAPEARYAMVRSIALAVVAVVPLTGERRDWLVAVAVAMVVVQAGDAVIGVGLRDRLKTIGPAVTAVVNLGLLVWYLTS